jgi:hypothetical protein
VQKLGPDRAEYFARQATEESVLLSQLESWRQNRDHRQDADRAPACSGTACFTEDTQFMKKHLHILVLDGGAERSPAIMRALKGRNARVTLGVGQGSVSPAAASRYPDDVVAIHRFNRVMNFLRSCRISSGTARSMLFCRSGTKL